MRIHCAPLYNEHLARNQGPQARCPPVFALYIALSLSGAFAAGLLFQFWQMV
ncbi:hypothetical protein [Roseovarius bejariae]|uniref:hypothetical protein n=1 Tax=Roseovarius bejariae TaxID=2576383 RepID=UPI0012ADCF2F|nr:hypothetical protein [Roseovarius bejariae]